MYTERRPHDRIISMYGNDPRKTRGIYGKFKNYGKIPIKIHKRSILMFRVKKDDYNSVQFLPDYSSSSVHTISRKRRNKALFTGIAIAVVIAVAAAVAGIYVYFTYLNPASQFARAFEAKDYEKCQDISVQNVFDEGFVNDIKDQVMNEAQAVLDSYKTGALNQDAASEELNNYNVMTDNCFKEEINSMLNEINAIEVIRSNVSDAQDTMLAGKYAEGVEKLISASAAASEYSLDLESEISSVVELNALNIKEALFKQFASLIKRDGYDKINAYIDFISKYDSDADYAEFKAVTGGVKDGTIKAKAASKQATAIAERAADDAAEQAQSTGTQGAEQ